MLKQEIGLPNPTRVNLADLLRVMGDIYALGCDQPRKLQSLAPRYSEWLSASRSRSESLGQQVSGELANQRTLEFYACPKNEWPIIDGLTELFQEMALSVLLKGNAPRALEICKLVLKSSNTLESPKRLAWQYLGQKALPTKSLPVSWLDLVLVCVTAVEQDHKALLQEIVNFLSLAQWPREELASFLYSVVTIGRKQWLLEMLLPLASADYLNETMWSQGLQRITSHKSPSFGRNPFAIQFMSRVCPTQTAAAFVLWQTTMQSDQIVITGAD